MRANETFYLDTRLARLNVRKITPVVAAFEPRASASGFCERINRFDETAGASNFAGLRRPERPSSSAC